MTGPSRKIAQEVESVDHVLAFCQRIGCGH
jgi:hypothetical protein